MTNKIIGKTFGGIRGNKFDTSLESADRYMDSLPGRFRWVRISLLKKRSTDHIGVELGQEVCDASKLLVYIRDSQGMILGKVSIKNQSKIGFGLEEEKMIREFAQGLGQQWSEKSV